MKAIRLFAVLTLLSFLSLADTTAAFDAFLKIDGIDGESTDRRHPREIQVLSFSWGVSNSGAGHVGGGGGAGKVSVQDLHIMKEVDKATPKLMLACATGKHIAKAVLTLRKSGGDRSEAYLKITMEDVLISSYQVSGSGGGSTDSVSFVFGKITVEAVGSEAAVLDLRTGKTE
jgi:type VI secretion system secreted protein Hcp